MEELMRAALADLVLTKLKDPRIGFATITSVAMTADLKIARVSVSVMGGDKEKKGTLAALQHAHGFLQKEVAHQLKLRFTPTLQFELDETLAKSFKINQVLEQLKNEGSIE
jgi:ribosome-binding factor A